ncbi:hypothetical protein LCGC14_0625810 [marine sediment metagenome]|uniref:Uncharacterized protein n=1 Tax=marine sediment metagenome TaxID=412755 RepID=A0A0F9RMT4_9ZZZZ
MVEVTVSNIRLSSDGNEKVVTADLTSVGNGETWNVPHVTQINHWTFTCTIDDVSGGTTSGNVITFANGTSLEGTCRVWGV